MDLLSDVYRSCADVFDLICLYLEVADLLALTRINRFFHKLFFESRCSVWLTWWKNHVSTRVLPIGTARTLAYDVCRLVPSLRRENNAVQPMRDLICAAERGYEVWLRSDDPTYNHILLVKAATNGHLEVCRSLLRLDMDPIDVETITEVAKGGHLDVLDFLLQNRTNYALVDAYVHFLERIDHTLLEVASFVHRHILLYMLNGDVPFDKNRLLRLVAMRGDLEIVQTLIQRGFNEDIVGAFRKAIEYHHYDIAKFLCDQEVNLTPEFGWALGHCIAIGAKDMAHFLLERGANPRHNDDGVIIDACSRGHLDIAQHLVRLGANPRVRDDFPLTIACFRGHLEVAEWLLDLGADPNAQEALTEACNHMPVMKLLIERGAHVTFNALKKCISNRSIDTFVYLFDRFDKKEELVGKLLGAARRSGLHEIATIILQECPNTVEPPEVKRTIRYGEITPLEDYLMMLM